MKPWYDEKAAYIAPDVALSECVPALITDATLTTVLGACEQFGAEDARRLMENQFRAADYTGAADLSDGGYSRDAMLEMLFRHAEQARFHCRFKWQPNSIAFWDNRWVQHYGVADYTERRVMQRVTIEGERPV